MKTQHLPAKLSKITLQQHHLQVLQPITVMFTIVSTAVALWVGKSLFCETMLDTTTPFIYAAAL
jgi:hypothetical protein